MVRKRFIAACLGLLLAAAAAPARAVPILDGGWSADVADGTFVPTVASPYVFVLTAPAYLRVVDCCVAGDTWFVTDSGSPLLTTAFSFATVHPGAFGDDFTGFGLDTSWVSASYTRGEIVLLAGPHSLSLSTDGPGGIPAHVGVRLDSVPEPTTLALLGGGLFSLGWKRRRRRG
jgi:PEP-CTERM motif